MLYSPLGKTVAKQLETFIHCTDQPSSARAVSWEHPRHARFTALHSEVQVHVFLLGKAVWRRSNHCDKVLGRGGDGSAWAHKGCGQGHRRAVMSGSEDFGTRH